MPALLPFLFLAACSSSQDPDPRAIQGVSAELRPVLDGTEAFAWDLLRAGRALEEEDENTFLSPFSVAAALSMVYAGSRGQTAEEVAAALHVEDEAEWHEQMAALLADLCGEHHRPYTLAAADRLWGQKGEPFERDFLDFVEETYQAPLEEVDFSRDPERARGEINEWVEEQTLGHIRELFHEGDIDALTRLVLVNAIAFEAEWETALEDGEVDDFELPGGEEVEVPFLEIETELPYLHADGASLVRLPYEGGEVSLVLAVPEQDDGLDELLAELEPDRFDGWMDEMETETVYVRLPSFEFSHRFPLKAALSSLGIELLFDPNRADLSGILDPSVERLYIGSAVHEAYVRLDEEGTTAAAATGMVAEAGCADSGDVETEPWVVADHPFLFAIRDELTGLVLFAGVVADPSAAPLAD